MRGMLGVALAIMTCVAREGVLLHGRMTPRDALAFYKICGAQLRIWTLAETKDSFRQFIERASRLISYRPSGGLRLDSQEMGGVDWCVARRSTMARR